MRSCYKYVLAVGVALSSVQFSQAAAQQAASPDAESSALSQSYKIVFRQRFAGFNFHIAEDYKAGFYYTRLCSGAQSRGVEVFRLFIDQVGNVMASGATENYLAFGYTQTAAECAELRRSLEKINGEPAAIEFRSFVNAQRPLLWLSMQDGLHQIVVNGRAFNIYRHGSWNPFN